PHPRLEPILKETYGVIVYQEQVMKVASELAGFSLGQADILRKAMGKKQKKVMEKQRELFIKGAQKNKIKKNIAAEVFDLIAYFAGYGFNKSHSVSYAYISYQTAYLKKNYPVEYMASLLTSIMGNSDKISLYIRECQNMGIQILPPEINQSLVNFTVVGNKSIRFGMAAVKNVGEKAIESIIEERKKNNKYKSLFDFCQRVDLRVINKRVTESLIRCGSFDSLGGKKSQLLAVLDEIIKRGQEYQKDKKNGQTSIFDLFENSQKDKINHVYQYTLPNLEEFSENELLAMEKEMLGLYISQHPLKNYQKKIEDIISVSLNEAVNLPDGSSAILAGVINRVRKKSTKNGNLMAFISLKDLEGSIEAIIFPKVYEKNKEKIKKDELVVIEGSLDIAEEKVKLIAKKLSLLKEYKKSKKNSIKYKKIKSGDEIKRLHIEIKYEKNQSNILLKLKEIFIKYPGRSKIMLHFKKHEKSVTHLIDDKFSVKLNHEIIKEIENIIGLDRVWLDNK
ncbi:MAG: DNA polymerase III subunit alpha, partial [Candidatus Caldatribacteriota bacterium]|nr:DNA polymerase III subunit alpha [Candidatus Caldatribacteriota bacterium]